MFIFSIRKLALAKLTITVYFWILFDGFVSAHSTALKTSCTKTTLQLFILQLFSATIVPNIFDTLFQQTDPTTYIEVLAFWLELAVGTEVLRQGVLRRGYPTTCRRSCHWHLFPSSLSADRPVCSQPNRCLSAAWGSPHCAWPQTEPHSGPGSGCWPWTTAADDLRWPQRLAGWPRPRSARGSIPKICCHCHRRSSCLPSGWWRPRRWPWTTCCWWSWRQRWWRADQLNGFFRQDINFVSSTRSMIYDQY